MRAPAAASAPTAAQPAPPRSSIDPDHPWPWLDAFTEDAQAYFNGREDDAEALLRCVLSAPATVLFGKSGLGKTSLVQAGLAPRLRQRRQLPVLVRIDHRSEQSASSQLLRRLKATVQQAGLSWQGEPRPRCNARTPATQLWEQLHDRQMSLVDARGQRWLPVFVLDQFEEAFTLLDDAGPRRAALFTELGDLIEGRIPPAVARRQDAHEELLDRLDAGRLGARFVLSLREDYLPDLEVWADRIPRLGPNRCRLLPLSQPQALAAVQLTGGRLVDADDARQIVDFLGRGGASRQWIEPALLSLICAGLNQRRLEQQPPAARLDTRQLATQGQALLERFYTDAFAALPEARRSAVQAFVERELITGDGTRRPYPRDAALRAGLAAEDLATLTRQRLLRIDNTEAGDFIELVHDRLAAIAAEHARLAHERAAHAAREAELIAEGRRRRDRYRSWAIQGGLLALVAVSGAGGFGALKMQEAAEATRTAESAASAAVRASESERSAKLLAETAARQARAATYQASEAARQAEQRASEAQAAELRASEAERRARVAEDLALRQGVSAAELARQLAQKKIEADDAARQAQRRQVEAQDAARSALVLRLIDASRQALAGVAGGGWELALQLLASAQHWQALDTAVPAASLPVAPAELVAGYKWSAAAAAEVLELTCSADGLHLYTVQRDQTVQQWNARTGQPAGKPAAVGGPAIRSVAASRDGSRLALGRQDGSVLLWDTRAAAPLGEPIRAHAGAVSSVALSGDGQLVASGGLDGSVRLWNAREPRRPQPIGEPGRPPAGAHAGRVTSLAFSPDASALASGSTDETVQRWDTRSAQPVGAPLAGHAGAVTSLAYHPLGQRIASASEDRSIRVWDAASGRPALAAPLSGHAAAVTRVAYTPDGARIVSASLDQSVRLWDAAGGQAGPATGELATDHAGPVTALVLSPEGARLAYASAQRLQLWNLSGAHPPTVGQSAYSASPTIAAIAMLPGQTETVAVGMDGSLRIWRHDTGSAGRVLAEADQPSTTALHSVAASPTRGGQIVSGSSDGMLQAWAWQGATGQLTRSAPAVRAHERAINALAYSPDARVIASASDDRSLRLWDATTRQPLGAPLTGHAGPVSDVAFSPDGQRIASASGDGSVRVWSWDGRNARLLRILTAPDAHAITRIAWRPGAQDEGRRQLLAGTRTGQLLHWQADTGQLASTQPAGHAGAINALALSPAGQILASGGDDRTVRYWQLDAAPAVATTTGAAAPAGRPVMQQVGQPVDYPQAIHGIAYNRQGNRTIVVGHAAPVPVGASGAGRADWRALLCANTRTSLSRADWQKWGSDEFAYSEPCPGRPARPD